MAAVARLPDAGFAAAVRRRRRRSCGMSCDRLVRNRRYFVHSWLGSLEEFHPANSARINPLLLNQVAEGDFVSALRDYRHSRADSRAANSPLVPPKRKKAPARWPGRPVRGAQIRSVAAVDEPPARAPGGSDQLAHIAAAAI